MFMSIMVCHRFAIVEHLLHAWVYHELFTDGMAGELPGELVLPSFLFIFRLGAQDSIILILQFAMIVFDHFGHASRCRSSGAEASTGT